MEGIGIVGLLVLIADIYAIIKVVQSGADTATKTVWVIVILLLPVIGLVLWFFMGPGGGTRAGR